MQARKSGRVCLLNQSDSVFAGRSVRGQRWSVSHHHQGWGVSVILEEIASATYAVYLVPPGAPGRKPTPKFSLSLLIERHCPQEEWP
jgi:hypothetical protein